MDRPVHPEQQPGEIFAGNVWTCDFTAVGWKTKRLGRLAYHADGRRMPNVRPFFVGRAEIDAAGVSVPRNGPIDHRW